MHLAFLPRRLLIGCLLLLAMASIGARLGVLHWTGDVLALVLEYYVVFAAVLLLLFAAGRWWRWSAAAGIVLLLNAQWLLGSPGVQPAALPGTERSLRVLVYNVYYENTDLSAAIRAVEHHDADIVFLMEYSFAVQRRIEAAFDGYPYRIIRPSRYARGLALFSRIPLRGAQVHRFDDTRIPIYEVSLSLGGRHFTFVGGHPHPPQPRWGALHRTQMQLITRIAERATSPLIVAGDFNAAPWSFTMRRLARQGQVLPIRNGPAPSITWRPIRGFGLPIDHVFVSREWQVIAQQYGASGGSDHVPLFVDLRLR